MKLQLITSVGILLAAGLQGAQSAVIDLTTAGSMGEVNGALFHQIPEGSTGTGVIGPFVRLQEKGTEEGYNTSLSPMPDVKTGIWTRELLLSEVPVVTFDSIEYYQFLLDINENNGNDNEFITLHQLQIFTKSGPLVKADTYLDLTTNADLKWDLDAGEDSRIELNYSLNPGSGYGDMFAYIPVTAVGTDTTKNLYLFSAFGNPSETDAGFEEWAVLEPTPTNRVPDGGTTLAALGFALLGLGSIRRFVAAKA